MTNVWPPDVDGLAVLKRIREDRGRVRLQTINTTMAEAARAAISGLLPLVDEPGRAELIRLAHHIDKVLAARRRARGL